MRQSFRIPHKNSLMNNKLRLIGVAKDALTAGPATINLDITTACNINCNFCWIHALACTTRTPVKTLSLNAIQHAADQAAAWNANEIMLSGDGEPTSHPKFKEIIDYIHSQRLSIFLATNATFPASLLKTVSQIDRLYVNFSAPTQELYAAVQSPKNPNNFTAVIRNLRTLSALAKRYGKPVINSAYIINKTNFRHVPEAMRLLNDVGIKDVTFRMMEPTPFTKPLLLSEQDKKELARLMAPLLKKKHPLTHNLDGIHQELMGKATSPYRLKHCFSGWYNIFVDFNANVGICCHNENLVMGNLNKASLKEIWESPRAHKMRLMCKHDFNIQKKPFKGECEWCHWHAQNQSIEKALKTIPC